MLAPEGPPRAVPPLLQHLGHDAVDLSQFVRFCVHRHDDRHGPDARPGPGPPGLRPAIGFNLHQARLLQQPAESNLGLRLLEAVVGHHDHRGLVPAAGVLQLLEQVAQVRVNQLERLDGLFAVAAPGMLNGIELQQVDRQVFWRLIEKALGDLHPRVIGHVGEVPGKR